MDSIIIVGMKHSGKSSLGKGLAAYFSLEFFDTDKIIEEKTNMHEQFFLIELRFSKLRQQILVQLSHQNAEGDDGSL